jgi:hypothetical protein
MTIFKGTGIVWDKEKNKPLCKFNKGLYETDDARVIRLLKEIPTVALISEEKPAVDEKPAVIEQPTEPEKTKKEIIALLDEAKIEYNPRDKKDVLIGLLEG